MLADELNLKWHKEWRNQVVDAFVACRDIDMGEHVEMPLADWERLQKALMQAPSRTLPFVETVEQLVRGKCICSDGPFHYPDCPQYTKGCNDSFAKLGTAMSNGT